MGMGTSSRTSEKKMTLDAKRRLLKNELAWHEEEVKRLIAKLEEADKTYEARVTGKNVIILNERLR